MISSIEIDKDEIWIGLDPGIRRFGFGIIKGNEVSFFTRTYKKYPKCLAQIYSDLHKLLKEHNPKHVIIEKQFSGYMPRIEGVISLVCEQKCINTLLIAPNTMKRELTGNGKATKRQVAVAVSQELKIPLKNIYHEHKTKKDKLVIKSDEADALGLIIAGKKEVKR